MMIQVMTVTSTIMMPVRMTVLVLFVVTVYKSLVKNVMMELVTVMSSPTLVEQTAPTPFAVMV